MKTSGPVVTPWEPRKGLCAREVPAAAQRGTCRKPPACAVPSGPRSTGGHARHPHTLRGRRNGRQAALHEPGCTHARGGVHVVLERSRVRVGLHGALGTQPAAIEGATPVGGRHPRSLGGKRCDRQRGVPLAALRAPRKAGPALGLRREARGRPGSPQRAGPCSGSAVPADTGGRATTSRPRGPAKGPASPSSGLLSPSPGE